MIIPRRNRNSFTLLKSSRAAIIKNQPSLLTKAVWMIICILCINAHSAFGLTPQERKTMAVTLTGSVNRLRSAADLQYPQNGFIGTGSVAELKKSVQLMNDGIALSRGVSDEFLDWLCPGLKTAYREHCIKGAEIFVQGIVENNIKKQALGIAVTEPWLDFYERNGELIGEKLETYCR